MKPRPQARVLLIAVASLLTVGIAGTARAHSGAHDRIQELTHRIDHRPKDAALYLQRSRLYLEHGDLQLAARDVRRAAVLAPELPTVHWYAARVAMAQKRYRRVLTHLDRFEARISNQPSAYILRGLALVEMGKLRRAAQSFEHALSMQPRAAAELYLDLARTYRALGEHERALAHLEAGLRIHPGSSALTNAALELERKLGQHQRALARLDAMPKRLRNTPRMALLRGDLCRALGRLDEARAAYRAVLERIDSYPPKRRQAPAHAQVKSRAEAQLASL